MRRNTLKSFVIFIISVLVFAGSVRMVYNLRASSRKNDVVLRFAVSAKSHIYDVNDEKLGDFFEKVYLYADKQKYNKVDAIIINGELTGDGSEVAFDALNRIVKNHLKDETQFFFTTGEADFSLQNDENVKNYIWPNAVDFVKKINGFNFVFWSPVYNSYATKFQWLDSTLDELTSYNSAPVFVFQYATLIDTYYGSDNWYTYESSAIMDILEKYPTVVDFSSSSATPSNTIRSIFQKNATYVSTGALTGMKMNYEEFGASMSKEVTGPHINNASQCKIVEVYGDGRVDIKTMDVNTGNIYGQWNMGEEYVYDFYPGNKDTYAYNVSLNASVDLPEFVGSKTVEAEKLNDNSLSIKFEEAVDNDGVLMYSVAIFDREKNIIGQKYIYSNIALYNGQKMKECIWEDIETTKIRSVEVAAYDMYGNLGETIRVELKY